MKQAQERIAVEGDRVVIGARVHKETLERAKKYCRRKNISQNLFFEEAIDFFLKHHNKKKKKVA